MCSGLVSADFKENGNIMLRENHVFAAIYSQSAIFKLIHTHTHTKGILDKMSDNIKFGLSSNNWTYYYNILFTILSESMCV